MIRIIVGSAKNDTIGDRNNMQINEERFNMYEENKTDMNVLWEKYKSDNVVGGPSEIVLKTLNVKDYKNSYALSRDKNIKLDGATREIEIITDFMSLVEKYKNSDEELVVVGGLTAFNLFTPYADILEIVAADIDLPGNLVYDGYKNDRWSLEVDEKIPGGTYKKYIAK